MMHLPLQPESLRSVTPFPPCYWNLIELMFICRGWLMKRFVARCWYVQISSCSCSPSWPRRFWSSGRAVCYSVPVCLVLHQHLKQAILDYCGAELTLVSCRSESAAARTLDHKLWNPLGNPWRNSEFRPPSYLLSARLFLFFVFLLWLHSAAQARECSRAVTLYRSRGTCDPVKYLDLST